MSNLCQIFCKFLHKVKNNTQCVKLKKHRFFNEIKEKLKNQCFDKIISFVKFDPSPTRGALIKSMELKKCCQRQHFFVEVVILTKYAIICISKE